MCEWCLADLTTPTTDGDVSSHISECGVVRNLVTWLCSPLLTHGHRTARPARRGVGADGSGLEQSTGTAAETPKRKLTISTLFQRQQCRRHYQGDANDGCTSDSTGERSSSHAEPEQLHPLSSQRTGWDHFRHPEPVFGMEEERKARPLRQHLFLDILLTMTRVLKIQQCKKGDQLLEASIKSQLEDLSWPFLQWCHQTKALLMDELINSLHRLRELCQMKTQWSDFTPYVLSRVRKR